MKVGNLIAPQVFEKIAIRNGRIVYEKVTIVVRKIPLVKIRKELLEKRINICSYKLMMNLNKYLRTTLSSA